MAARRQFKVKRGDSWLEGTFEFLSDAIEYAAIQGADKIWELDDKGRPVVFAWDRENARRA